MKLAGIVRRTTILLSLLKVSSLYSISCGCYVSPKEQNFICKLCTFFEYGHIVCTDICFNPVGNPLLTTPNSNYVDLSYVEMTCWNNNSLQ